MAGGHENLIPFNKRSEDEAREFGRKGGKKSGETRRRNKAFKEILNTLLSSEIDVPEWTPFLKAMGLDSTLGDAVNAAMIREALSGNVKAYEAIAKYSGQSDKTDRDEEEQSLRMSATKAKMGVNDDVEQEDDGFLDALRGTAADDWEGYEHEAEDQETDF